MRYFFRAGLIITGLFFSFKVNATEESTFTKAKAIVVVDPFGFQAGELLPQYIVKQGFETICVLSSNRLPPFLLRNFKEGEAILHVDSLEETRRSIQQKNPDICAVIPGTETGIILADKLSEVLGLATNGSSLSENRRDKFLMHQLLEEHKLSHATQFKTDNAEAAFDWLNNSLQNWRTTGAIIKPASSAGTDRIYVVKDIEDVTRACADIIGNQNALGDQDRFAVVQERLGAGSGIEYIFDFISTTTKDDGTLHLPVGAWQYFRKPSALPYMTPIIDDVKWIPYHSLPPQMERYAKAVLDVFGVKYGPTHLEIMYTPHEEKITLVEFNGRLPGGLPVLAKDVTGIDYLDRTIQSYIEPAELQKLYTELKGQYPTPPNTTACIVFLNVDEENQILSPSIQECLSKYYYPTFACSRIFAAANKSLPLTTNVTNALLRAHFWGPSDAVAQDVSHIKADHANKKFYLMKVS